MTLTDVDCGPYPNMGLAQSIPPPSTTYNHTVTYTCQTGYNYPDMSLSKVFACSDGFTWECMDHWEDTWDLACTGKEYHDIIMK